jgi:hypothetical protein
MTRRDLALAVVLGCITLAVRVPFLARSEAFFNSDEAVEGLMARHVLQGEFPTFYWAQSYKGVPEVYAFAAAIAAFGSRAVVLKSVTAVLFALYVALNGILLARWFDRRTAVGASLLAATGPPALMYWSLSANAEFVLVMLLGTVLLLLASGWERSIARRAWVGFVAGLGAWVHPLISIYLVPLAVLGLLRTSWWRANRGPALARAVAWGRSGRGARPVVLVLNAAALAYALLGVTAFVVGGLEFSLVGVNVTVHHPQKMAGVAAVLLLSSAAWVTHAELGAAGRLWREGWPGAAGFVAGYLPVVLHVLGGGRVGAPLRSMDAARLWRELPVLFVGIPRILSGFASPFAQALPVPAWLGLAAAGCLGLYLWASRRCLRDLLVLRPGAWTLADGFFPGLLLFSVVLFVVTGTFLDAYSYRYLIPVYSAVPVALVLGCRAARKWARWLPGTLFAVVLGTFAAQQALWFRTLGGESCDREIIACLRSAGVQGGWADYWISYRMTFISEESPIIAPMTGVDRYPAYSRFVAALDRQAEVRRPPAAGDAPQCGCRDLEAVVRRRAGGRTD